MKHLHFDEIDSTNTYLKREYQNLDNLTFVSALFQSNGHGRFSRSWHANKSESVMFSYLLKDKEYIDHFSYISMITAVLVVKYLEEKGLENVSIKWPNDVYVNGKKICGILLEGMIPEYVIVGVGINLNQKQFDNSILRHPATSVKIENPTFNFTTMDEIETIIRLFNDFWANFRGDWGMFDNFIKSHNYLLDKAIKVSNIDSLVQGKVVDIDSECNLLINNGREIVKINTGEIEIL